MCGKEPTQFLAVNPDLLGQRIPHLLLDLVEGTGANGHTLLALGTPGHLGRGRARGGSDLGPLRQAQGGNPSCQDKRAVLGIYYFQ